MQPQTINTPQNKLLKDVLHNYNFKLLKKGDHIELYNLDYSNADNCEGRLLIRVLSDGSLRLSITETDDEYLYNVIDLFEFKEPYKFRRFMKTILF